MTVADAIEKPNLSAVVLIEITAGKWVRNWTKTAGFTTVYEVVFDRKVTDVKFSGASGTVGVSVVDVEANPGAWFWDGTKLYVTNQDDGTASVFANTIVAFSKFYFANTPKTFGSQYYEPRLLSAPNVSLRIEEKFGGVGQIGGGSITLANNDRFFDTLTDWKLNNGSVALKLGVDTPNEQMAFADYQPLAAWLIQDWTKEDDKFTLTLKEIKSRIQQQLPLNVFTTSAYPLLPQDSIGQPIPLAYGKVIGAAPILVDPSTKKFRVADHAIFSFDDVKINGGGGWKQSSFASVNLAAAEFTLGADWDGSASVSVDFSGKKNGDGTLMTNASDIVKDLFALVGETDLNSASFTTAKDRLDAGTNEDGRRITLRAPSLYISESQDLFDLIGQINEQIGSYTYVDATGKYFFGVFQPQRGEALKTFTDIDLIDFAEETNNSDLVSKVTSRYARREAEGYSQIQIDESTANQHAAGLPSARRKEPELDLNEISDAKEFNQRLLITEGRGHRVLSVSLNWRGWLLMPGDQIRVVYSRQNLDAVAEVYEVTYDLAAPTVRLRVGNLRGLSDTPGFWVQDSEWAVSLDGSNDYVAVPHSSVYDFGHNNNFSVELWIKANSTQPAPAGFPVLIEKYRGAGISFLLGVRTSDGVLFGLRSDGLGNVPQAGAVTDVTDDKWHHVALVKDGSTMRIYVDGSQDATFTDTTASWTGGNGLLGIGGDSALPANNPFKGLIDEVRIWNVTRSAADILANLNKSLSGNESGLVGYWRFDCGSDTGVTPIHHNPARRNGGFETAGGGGADALADWIETVESGTGTITRDTTDKYEGAASCKFTIDAGNNGLNIKQSGALTAGKLYRVKFYSKTTDVSAGPQLELNSGISGYATFVLSTAWSLYQVDIVAADDVLQFRRNITSGSVSIWIDNVEVYELPQTAYDQTSNKNHGTLTNGPKWASASDNNLNDKLPSRFASLTGYGSGSLVWNKNWHADIKTWARQNVGYWTDENGFADPTDPDSFIPSAWT